MEFEHIKRGPEEITPQTADDILKQALRAPSDLIFEAARLLDKMKEDNRISLDDPRFVRAFGEAELERAKARVRQVEGKFQGAFISQGITGRRPERGGSGAEEGEFLARAMESLPVFDLYDFGWWGEADEQVFVTSASRHDDLINQTDIVAEFAPIDKEDKTKFLAVIDVTVSEDLETLHGKWAKTIDLLSRGNLGTFEYYISPRDGSVMRPKWGVPHIILVFPRKIAQELVVGSQLIERHKNTKGVEFLEEKLKNHSFRRDFQAQIYNFLLRLRDYALMLDARREKGTTREKRGGVSQRQNIILIEELMSHLEKLGYSTKISNPDIQLVFNEVFRLP